MSPDDISISNCFFILACNCVLLSRPLFLRVDSFHQIMSKITKYYQILRKK